MSALAGLGALAGGLAGGIERGQGLLEQRDLHQRRKKQWAEQDKLKAAWPDWADSEKQKAEAVKLRATAKAYGFSDKEIDGVADHRTLLLLRDAMQYRALKREPSPEAKNKTPAIRTARPGTSTPPPNPNQRHKELFDRAVSTRKLQDIAKAVENLID